MSTSRHCTGRVVCLVGIAFELYTWFVGEKLKNILYFAVKTVKVFGKIFLHVIRVIIIVLLPKIIVFLSKHERAFKTERVARCKPSLKERD